MIYLTIKAAPPTNKVELGMQGCKQQDIKFVFKLKLSCRSTDKQLKGLADWQIHPTLPATLLFLLRRGLCADGATRALEFPLRLLQSTECKKCPFYPSTVPSVPPQGPRLHLFAQSDVFLCASNVYL